MKLYVSRMSPNARRVLLVNALLEQPAEVVEVDMRAGAHKRPDYLAINPNHKVPALQDGAFTLWESNAIAQYLANRAGRTDLWPRDPADQADVSRWQLWTHTHWNAAIMPIVFERVVKAWFGRGAPDEAAVAAALPEFHTVAAIVEDRLNGRDWLACGRLTLADLSLAASLTWAIPARLPVDDHPRLAAWFERIRALDAWKSTDPTR